MSRSIVIGAFIGLLLVYYLESKVKDRISNITTQFNSGKDISCGFEIGYTNQTDGLSSWREYKYENIILNKGNSHYFTNSKVFSYKDRTVDISNCEVLQ